MFLVTNPPRFAHAIRFEVGRMQVDRPTLAFFYGVHTWKDFEEWKEDQCEHPLFEARKAEMLRAWVPAPAELRAVTRDVVDLTVPEVVDLTADSPPASPKPATHVQDFGSFPSPPSAEMSIEHSSWLMPTAQEQLGFVGAMTYEMDDDVMSSITEVDSQICDGDHLLNGTTDQNLVEIASGAVDGLLTLRKRFRE